MTELAKISGRASDDTSSFAALQEEIQKTQDARNDRSALRWAIDAITSPYHQSGPALESLQTLAHSGRSLSPGEINAAITENRAASQKEQDCYGIVGGMVKTLGMFTPRQFGIWTTGLAFAADEVKESNPNILDGFAGVTKGLLSRGAALWMSKEGMNPAAMSLGLGTVGRFVDTALTRSNYVDQTTGNVSLGSIGSGLLRTGEHTFAPRALGVDLATSALSFGLIKSTGGLLVGNRFRAVATTGFVSGYAGGMTEELDREQKTGEYNATRLLAFPLARAASSAVATMPGAQRQRVADYPREQAANTRDREYKLVAISGAEIKRIAAEKSPVDVKVKSVFDGPTFGPEETMRVGQQHAPIDWISFAYNKLTGRVRGITDAPDQLRIVSRANTTSAEAPSTWSMVARPGFRSVHDIVNADSKYFHRELAAPLLSSVTEPAFLATSGSESSAIMLANGAVMKVTKAHYNQTRDWGKVPNDAKLLHPLVNISPPADAQFFLYLQEFAKSPTPMKQTVGLVKEMPKHGYKLWDGVNIDGTVNYAHHQVGIDAHGKAVIIDYGARMKLD